MTFAVGDRVRWVQVSDMEGGYRPLTKYEQQVGVVVALMGEDFGDLTYNVRWDGEHEALCYAPGELAEVSIVEQIGSLA